jgi:hypothetical protein
VQRHDRRNACVLACLNFPIGRMLLGYTSYIAISLP